MSFDIFDEQYYLATNPDVAAAVQADLVPSGIAHFLQYGLEEGRTSVSPLYDENLYLQANPDVADAVTVGSLQSGLQHYLLYGEAEGRSGWLGLFNEQAYLGRYADVSSAVQAGIFRSGFEHFIEFGIQEGRFDALFNEQYYLQKYADVANAVSAGIFSSGLQHFLQFGLNENRSGGALFNESFYLRSNPDVASAVETGIFSSGWAHFAQFGGTEGRSGTYFNEELYRFANPDVDDAVQAGIFTSGLDHYLQFGQLEPARPSGFIGTSQNDIITSFGALSEMLGVAVEIPTLEPSSLGAGEVDILIGGSQKNFYNLGITSISGPKRFYIGGGSNDFALIRSFDANNDFIQLAGSFAEYTQQVVNGSLEISTTSGDLVGVVEGITFLLQEFSSITPETFLLG